MLFKGMEKKTMKYNQVAFDENNKFLHSIVTSEKKRISISNVYVVCLMGRKRVSHAPLTQIIIVKTAKMQGSNEFFSTL